VTEDPTENGVQWRMPKKLLSLESNAPKRLELSWRAMWKEFTVKLDGTPILTADGSGDLKAGKSVTLPDGATLAVKLETGFGKQGLVVTRNGVPLPGSSTDPETLMKTAGGIVYAIAALNAIVGVIAWVFDVRFLKENFGYGPLVVAALFAVLGYFTMKRSLAALIAAIVIYALDGLLTLGFQMSEAAPGHTPNVGFIFVRVIFLMAMIRGARAMSQRAKSE
jgi:hypothetical protein